MSLMELFQQTASGVVPVCALSAALELLLSDESASLGYRSVCGLAVALCALRAFLSVLG